MGEAVDVFMGTMKDDTQGSYEDDSDGELKVTSSTGLLWAIGCQTPPEDTDSDGEEARI